MRLRVPCCDQAEPVGQVPIIGHERVGLQAHGCRAVRAAGRSIAHRSGDHLQQVSGEVHMVDAGQQEGRSLMVKRTAAAFGQECIEGSIRAVTGVKHGGIDSGRRVRRRSTENQIES